MIKTTLRNVTPQPLYGLYAAFRRVLVRIKYTGNLYECTICNHHYRKFLADGSHGSVWKKLQIVGGGYRENAKCPWCSSVDRDRLMYHYIKTKTNLMSGTKKLLHIAPEENLAKIFRRALGENYTSGDLNPDSRTVSERIDIRDIKYPDCFFDAVICSNVLEHIPEDLKAMRELYRVLKPGGWAILQTPISAALKNTLEDWSVTLPADRERIFGQRDHVRIYAHDFKNRLEQAGFRVVVFDPEKEFGPDLVRRFAFFQGENLYLGFKN